MFLALQNSSEASAGPCALSESKNKAFTPTSLLATNQAEHLTRPVRPDRFSPQSRRWIHFRKAPPIILGRVTPHSKKPAHDVACVAMADAATGGKWIGDQVTFSRVRAALADATQHKYFDGVNVETFPDIVRLSGFVRTRALKNRDGDIAGDAAGGRDVRNNVTVKE